MATVFVGLFVVLIGKAKERHQASEEAHRLKKVEIYQGFIDMIVRMIGSSNTNLSVKQFEHNELVNYLFKFKDSLIYRYGDDKILAPAPL